MNIIVIIQARMGSSRLPGKVMLPLAGKPAIQHVIERAKKISDVSKVVVATSISFEDDKLAEFCKSMSVPVFRGNETDVLDRYYKAAIHFKADNVVRITGDCPLLDPIESSKVVQLYKSMDIDYTSNVNPPMLPDGLDTEVMSMNVLEAVWKEAKKKSEREHVTLYIYSNSDKFNIENVKFDNDLSHYRWTLDERNDYLLLCAIYNELEKLNQFGYLHEVLNIFVENPHLYKINKNISRNEGLVKSTKEEETIS